MGTMAVLRCLSFAVRQEVAVIRGMSPAGDADEEGGIEDGSGGDDRFVEGRRGAIAFGEFLPDGRCGEVEISQSLQVAQSDAQRPVVYFPDEFGTV